MNGPREDPTYTREELLIILARYEASTGPAFESRLGPIQVIPRDL